MSLASLEVSDGPHHLEQLGWGGGSYNGEASSGKVQVRARQQLTNGSQNMGHIHNPGSENSLSIPLPLGLWRHILVA